MTTALLDAVLQHSARAVVRALLCRGLLWLAVRAIDPGIGIGAGFLRQLGFRFGNEVACHFPDLAQGFAAEEHAAFDRRLGRRAQDAADGLNNRRPEEARPLQLPDRLRDCL